MNFDISKAVMWLFGQACPEEAKSKHWFSNRDVEKKKNSRLTSNHVSLLTSYFTKALLIKFAEQFLIVCNPNLYLGCWLQFVYRGSPNQGVDFKYLKKARSKISPDDVYWSFDEKEGWSACSKTCAGGMAVEHYRNFFSFYFITLIIYNNYH